MGSTLASYVTVFCSICSLINIDQNSVSNIWNNSLHPSNKFFMAMYDKGGEPTAPHYKNTALEMIIPRATNVIWLIRVYPLHFQKLSRRKLSNRMACVWIFIALMTKYLNAKQSKAKQSGLGISKHSHNSKLTEWSLNLPKWRMQENMYVTRAP